MTSYKKMNFHTHTIFSDGRNTPEEIVKKAINSGFTHLGFSEHAYAPMDLESCMKKEDEKAYVEEINRLKELYKGDIKIYCGLELDYFSEVNTDGYDFLIGSCHYIEKNGEYYSIDHSLENFDKILSVFNNDAIEFADAYFKMMADIVNKFDIDIIGHFDIIRKFNAGNRFFDINNADYLKKGKDAIDKLLTKCDVFEINTGALARGYEDALYPMPAFIEYIKKKGGKLILSSDCHDADKLDYAFEEMSKLL